MLLLGRVADPEHQCVAGSGGSSGAGSRRSGSLAAAWHPLAAGPAPPPPQQPAPSSQQPRSRTPQQPDPPPSLRQLPVQQQAGGSLTKSGMTPEMQVRTPHRL